MVDMLLRRYFRGPHVSWAQAVHPVADDERGLLVWLPAGAGFACRAEPDGTPLRGAPAIEDYGAAPLHRRTWADRGDFPFDGTWQDFRPDPSWPMPNLPPNLL
ncbi:hypothetical protein ABT369_19445 [Dactylosporangium sp. NPDC000244]|uniref:hypothetical protein n=1 Tax=Dactylosporangium sp. NPDC000244 TaxID=3154365 RepID=UPI003330F15F